MTVYVDNAYLPFGRMKMCHLVADSRQELDTMADTIGLNRKWIQKAGTPHEHYDVSKALRAKAVAAGAAEITMKDLGQMIHQRRKVRRLVAANMQCPPAPVSWEGI